MPTESSASICIRDVCRPICKKSIETYSTRSHLKKILSLCPKDKVC